VQQGRAAGEHHARGEQVVLASLVDLVAHQLEQLLDARLDDLAEDAPREHPRGPAADAGHLDGLVAIEQRALGRAVPGLDPLRLQHRRAQADGDVVGEVVAAERDDAGVLDGAAGEDGHVGGAAADVDERDAQLLLLLGQHRLRRSERLEHDVGDREPGLGAALDDVLRARGGGGDDVDLGLQPHAAHAQRLLDAVLLVDHVLLRQHVEDLAVLGDVHRPGRVEHAVDVRLPDLLVLHRHHALGVEAADVAAGDAGVDRADLAARHQLRLLDGAADRGDGGVDVDHHALAQAARGLGADADDVDAVGRQLADDAADLGGADVEADDQLALLWCHGAPTPFPWTPARCGAPPCPK
jgi:hypothetical protein